MPIFTVDEYQFIGAASLYKGVFNSYGHIWYNNNGQKDMHTKIPPLIQAHGGVTLPHLALTAADDIRFNGTKLLVNGYDAGINAKGFVDFNYRPLNYFKTISLYYPMKRAIAGEVEYQINEGDIVLIIWKFAAGNTDFHEFSPFG